MIDLTYQLPASWACYLINDDCSGMDDAEIAACDAFMKAEKLPAPVGCNDDPSFMRHHDAAAYYPFATDCLDFFFLVPEEAEAPADSPALDAPWFEAR